MNRLCVADKQWEGTIKTLTLFALRVVINGAAIALAAAILPGIMIRHQELGTLLILGLVFGLINAFLKPILEFFALPFIMGTLGLLQLVLNALLLLLVARIVPDLAIDGFWPAFFGALIVSITSTVLERLLPRTLLRDAAHDRGKVRHAYHAGPREMA